MMAGAAPHAFFLPVGPGQRYCLYHAPTGATRSVVLHVHPFAEELNKTRRMAALQARALAAAGHAVLQIDLLGCGDSSGDFGDARWDLWIADLQQAWQWLATQPAHAELPLWLWGVRAGCLLATECARTLSHPAHLLFWQPSFGDGAMQLQQFLRLRLAADMLALPDAVGGARQAMQALTQQLARGEPLQIAGYRLDAALASSLRTSSLSPPDAAGTSRQLVWLETGTAAEPALSPLGARLAPLWSQAGWRVHSGAVSGPAFWQSTEIEEAPALLAATLAALGANHFA